MRFNVQNWIEEIKGKPENIRHRYMLGCVGVSMFFVVIVWSLTVSENFKNSDTEGSSEMSNRILPQSADFSLDQILSGEENLQEKQQKSGEEFLREQEANRARLNPEEDGIKPKAAKPESEPSM